MLCVFGGLCFCGEKDALESCLVGEDVYTADGGCEGDGEDL